MIYVEAKIDSSIRLDLISGVLEYLEKQNRFAPASFVVLKPREIDPNWYLGEFVEVLKAPGVNLQKTKGYLMHWEDIFKSCVDA